MCCFQWFKDTNLKANHNMWRYVMMSYSVVSNGSKILIWKQITTARVSISLPFCCFQWFKDTNLKANHNWLLYYPRSVDVVSNGSKILIWKQITTAASFTLLSSSCFQWFKDTNLKANHNNQSLYVPPDTVVSNGSKILIWKQITTDFDCYCSRSCCFQWFKDTNLKANHNGSSVSSE